MVVGPLEFIVMAFLDGTSQAEVAQELRRIAEQRSIQIVDLAFVKKVNGGSELMDSSEFDDSDLEPYASLSADLLDWLTPESLVEFAALAPSRSTVVVALLDHVWATRLSEAVARSGAGATLVAQERTSRAELEDVARGLSRR